MKLGVRADNFEVGGGVGELCIGLSLKAGGSVFQDVTGGRDSIESFVRSLKFKGELARAFDLNSVLEIMTNILAEIAKVSGLDYLVGGNVHVSGSCRGGTGASIEADVSLGWQDTEGYHMVGASGSLLVGGTRVKSGVNNRNHTKIITGFSMYGASFSFTIYVRGA